MFNLVKGSFFFYHQVQRKQLTKVLMWQQLMAIPSFDIEFINLNSYDV